MLFRLFLKDWRVFMRDKVSLSLTFLVPVVLIYIFGQVFGGTAGGRTQPVTLPFLNLSDAAMPKSVEGALAESERFRLVRGIAGPEGVIVPFTAETLRAHVQAGRARMALLIPEDQGAMPFGLKAKLFVDPRNEIETSVAEGLLNELVFRQLPQAFRMSAKESLGDPGMKRFQDEMSEVVARNFETTPEEARRTMEEFLEGPSPTTGDGQEAAKDSGAGFLGELVSFEKEQVTGAQVRSPGPTRQVGGWALMFLLFAVSGFATSLFEEKSNGITLRILSGPATRNQLLMGKFLFSISLGVVQLSALFLAGWILFRVDIFSNLPSLMVAVLAASAACTAFGMFLASISRTASQVSGLATFLILTMSAVGGAWFPVSMMPDAVQVFSRLTIVFWAQESFYDALWRQLPVSEMLANAGVLVVIAVAVSSLALWRFRRSPLL
jgi:ABC-2 type transport system permease protein